jgi:hypothetical protein
VSRRIKDRVTYANVVSTLCLFVLLGGGAYAASELPKDSVGSKQLKARAVHTEDLADDAITSPKVADGSLLGADFAPGQLPAGRPGKDGSPDTAQQVLDKLKTVDTDSSGLNADTVDGRGADELVSGRIHITDGADHSAHQVLPGLSYGLQCNPDGAVVSFNPQGGDGTFNASAIASGIENPGTTNATYMSIVNGAQDQGFAYPGGQSLFLILKNESGTAQAESQLIIDVAGRTYSIALHSFARFSDSYCEVTGTATLGV